MCRLCWGPVISLSQPLGPTLTPVERKLKKPIGASTARYEKFFWLSQVEINWDQASGAFVSLNETNGFVASKLEGASRIKDKFAGGETLIVGDGFTDFKLYDAGIASDFVAYVEHAARDKVINAAKENGRTCAGSIKELRAYICERTA